MINLLLEDVDSNVFEIVGIIVVWIIIFAVIIVKGVQQAKNKSSTQAKQHSTVDSNIRTKSQNDYLNNLRAKKNAKATQQPTVSEDHDHVADDVEHYDKIVGSLGEVEEEGCSDLDGVRLIAHDIAYENDGEGVDYSNLAKAIVIGEVINSPRFKNKYRK